MQPYSELANWDGSLEDVVVDSLDPPSPTDTPPLPMYSQYHSVDHQTGVAHILSTSATTTTTTSSSLPSSSSHFGPSVASAVLFASTTALSPQEREIMADITLDPDDPDDLESSRVASSAGATASSTVTGGAWAWAALAPEAAMKNVNNDASGKQSRSSIVTSVSPSPFAPPPASSSIAETVSQPLPLPSSSSSSSPHLAVRAKSPDVVQVHPDQLAHSSGSAGIEHVKEHSSASVSRPDAGEAEPRGNSATDHLDAFTHDPPDQPQPRALSRQSPMLPPLDTANHPSSSRSSPRHSPKTPLFLPSPSESAPPSRPMSDSLPPEECDVISIDSSSSSSSSSLPPPTRRLRSRNTRIKAKTNKQGRQLMAYVLIPPLPSAVRKSNYVPRKKVHRMREHSVRAKKKAPIGDNTSSTALVAALQGAFENNSIGAGSTKTARARRKRRKTKAVAPVEVVEVVDDVGEGEDDGELSTKGSNNLARALSSAFAHNSTDPNVAARPAAEEKGRTHQLRRSTHAEVLSDGSTNVEVILPPLPAKRSRPTLRTKVTLDAEGRNAISSRLRNEKRLPQTPTSPQKKKRRRLSGRGDGVDEEEGEEEEEEDIEIVDCASRELPRRASKTMPQSYSKAERSTRKHRRTSIPFPAPTSTHASLPSPSPSSPPESPTASLPDTNSLAGLPLTILPAPSATDIVIPARALNHLHAPSSPLDPKSKFETRHQESVQGFHSEEAAVGAHGLLESPSVVIAISSVVATATTTTATIIDSSIRASPTSPQNPPMDLGLDVIVPMDVIDGEQERQDAVQAAVVPPHALRISSSTHPDGPMLGFMLSEHDSARRTTSLSADTEASSEDIGLQLGAKTTADMEFMLLDSIDHNSALNADPGWVDWHATAPSTGLVVENEFVGDGTIDPAVLGGTECFGASLGGGSPNKAVFRSDDYIRSHWSSRVRDNDKSLNNDDSDDLGDEGDVMGLLFENSTDSTGSRSPSARRAGGKGKNKDTTTVDGADTSQIITGINAGKSGARKRRKSWRKALADNNDNYEDTDTESHDTVPRPLSNVSNNLSSLTTTFCHHCRRKTFRPKMCCTRIRETTGKQCGKMYCDHCIQKRYPSLTFDEFATSFSCPCCGNFCNCTHCARGRGEAYIPERNGGWRRWASLFPVAAAAATSGPIPPSRKDANRDATVAKAVLTAQELEVDDTMRIVPDEPVAMAPLPLSLSHHTSNTLISSPHFHVHPIPTISTATTKYKKRCRHAYIGKWQKLWGSVPVLDPDPEDRQGSGRSGRNGRNKRKRAVRVRLFVGSEIPLLLRQKRANNKKNQKNLKRGPGRKKKKCLEMEKNEQRHIASSLPPPSQISSVGAHNEGDANQNATLNEEHNAEPDGDADIDKGFWPGEYGFAYAQEQHITFMPPGVTVASDIVATTISPEELERAIGAAFAVGMQY